MTKESISKAAVRQVLRDYWREYTRRPLRAFIALTFPSVGNIFVFFIPPLIVAGIINTFVAQNRISLSAVSISVMLFGALWLAGEVMWRIGMHAIINVETEGMRHLAKLAYRRLADRDYDFYTNHFVGSLTKDALAYSRNFETFTDTLGFNVIGNLLPISFAIIILWRYSPWIPMILTMAIAVVIAVAVPIIRRRSGFVRMRHNAASKVSGRLSDSITNILAVKSFAKEKSEAASYGTFVDDFVGKFKVAADYQNMRFDLTISPLYVVTNIIGLVLAIYFASILNLSAGTILIVFAYFSQVTRVFWEVSRVYRNIESSISESAEFTEMFLNPPAIQDTSDATELSVTNARVCFEKIGFSYHADQSRGGGKLFFKNFSLDIRSNQKVGLVGPSGGGKTTITKLLLRFIEVNAGRITIDGQDISTVTQSSLREAIAYVPQEPLLFHRSLFENIAYSNERATKAEVLRAARLAHADEFIADLPNGYDTLVGERGIKLSGGQRQRITIARAILKKAPILVLDEATSSLDSASEKYIQEGLWELMKDRTALVIAHRLSTIRHLDRIVVLSDGKIVQDGMHDELIGQRGLYAQLWRHQSGEFLRD